MALSLSELEAGAGTLRNMTQRELLISMRRCQLERDEGRKSSS